MPDHRTSKAPAAAARRTRYLPAMDSGEDRSCWLCGTLLRRGDFTFLALLDDRTLVLCRECLGVLSAIEGDPFVWPLTPPPEERVF